MTFNLTVLLTYLVSWNYLLVNVLITFTSIPGIILLGVRECWMIILFIQLVNLRRVKELSFIALCFALGIAFHFFSDVYDNPMHSIISLTYFFRDICLIIFVVLVLTHPEKILSYRILKNFIIFIVVISVVEVISKFFDPIMFYNLIDVPGHLAAKGVRAQFGFGLIGYRTTGFFYSPNLLGTFFASLMLITLFMKKSFFKRGMYYLTFLSVGAFTGTKAVLLALVYSVIARFHKHAIWIVLSGVFVSYEIIHFVYYNVEMDPLLRYHFASTLGHFHSFVNFFEDFKIVSLPDHLGYNSTTMRVISDKDLTGIESLLLSRILDLRLLSLFLLLYLIYYCIRLKGERAYAFGFFIICSLFTATSNLPVAYLPFALLSFPITKVRL